MSTTWSDVLALLTQLDESGVVEAEVVADGVSVRVSRAAGGLSASRDAAPAAAAATPVPATPAPAASAPTPSAPPASAAPVLSSVPSSAPSSAAGDLVDVTAPILGVLYRRPAPDRAEFVRVGDLVEPDTTVAILEVMKMMNQVTAGVAGRVAEILVEDGVMVEHGDVLLRVEPA
ncbi:biotin/lipoyl-containing protein [Nocardioides sp. CFH 31398]|uniref:acetyl-CoA carboxylase biotin carboxyl carrier protein n=1 Tax=Nocardioides sp. CFH 31398 TaxID=2919579 RepID=UPI001F069A64|nr:biotin/lipoyl-containing protein [Nocardioides sp. CFH 31398]MCH1865501.1 biotin/lipoyl-binding protein [Nocardioides sp. CFH 31398]